MHIASGNGNKYGDSTVNLQQGVQLDRPFVFSEFGPGEKRQTEIDGGGVEGVSSGLQFESQL